jgi:hypothetical protein
LGLTFGSYGGGGALTGNKATRLTLVNTIVAQKRTDGTGPDIFALLDGTSHHNLIGDGSGMSGISNGINGNLVGTGASPIDPRLGPLGPHGGATETRAAVGGSPVLNAGDPAQLGSADQRGALRLGGVNIGAYQASATNFKFFYTAPVTAGTPFDLVVPTAIRSFRSPVERLWGMPPSRFPVPLRHHPAVVRAFL